MLVILTAVFLSVIVEIEWDINRLAAFVNFSTGVTVPAACHSDGRSTNAVSSFVVLAVLLCYGEQRQLDVQH